jgi:hypothetical protein
LRRGEAGILLSLERAAAGLLKQPRRRPLVGIAGFLGINWSLAAGVELIV